MGQRLSPFQRAHLGINHRHARWAYVAGLNGDNLVMERMSFAERYLLYQVPPDGSWQEPPWDFDTDFATLGRYVKADRELIQQHRRK